MKRLIDGEVLLNDMNDYPFSGDVRHFYNEIQSGKYDVSNQGEAARYRENEYKTIESIKGALSALGMRGGIDDAKDILCTALQALSIPTEDGIQKEGGKADETT